MPNLLHYYNRFDPSKNYEKHLFRSGMVLESPELNEIQEYPIARIKAIADVMFKDGDIIKDASIAIDQDTGATNCAAGTLYLRGAVRSVGAAAFSIPVDKTVAIGIYLTEKTITELEDPSLRDPSVEVINYQEPGAARLQINCAWGWQASDAKDGQDGEFYPVYTSDFGVLRVKSTPPQLDSMSQAIARYDRDSTGGDYVVSGLKVTKLPDINGVQQYSIDAGSARVNGFAVDLPASRRLPYEAAPDIRFIDSEPFLSATIGAQRVTFDRAPVQNITQVRITAQKVADIVHGSFLGSQDPIPDNSIVEIIAVNQGGVAKGDLSGFTGGTNYVQGSDFKLTGQKIDWSLSGAEVNIGSTYKVIYRYITSVEPTGVDDTGYTVSGAVPGSLIMTSYNVMMPRVDRLCLTQDGTFEWIKGTSTDFDPVPPPIPNQYLPLAQVYQAWTNIGTYMQNDGLRVVPMKDLEQLSQRIDLALDLIAQGRLTADANSRSAAAKKGVFVDPFYNDNLRDSGIAQTAAIVNGELVLPISATFSRPSNDVTTAVVLNAALTVVLQQKAITGSMLINPYSAFDPIPASLRLDPPVDHFTVSNTSWTSDGTATLYQGSGVLTMNSGTTTSNQVVSSTTKPAQYLRQIDVTFDIDGFKPNEQLASMTFDGIAVVPVAAP